MIATRTVRSLDELASTVSVKTADDLERELARDISDLVRFEPGVTVAGAGSRFGLTGFSIRGIGGNRVLTMIDGIRVPEEFSFGPFLSARRDYVDIDSLSRAEIARGPVSSLYGSDALGGVVALTTRQPSDYLDADRTFSGSFKGGYSGVDKNTAGTVSLAARSGPASGLILYTRRTGQETANAGSVAGRGAERELPDPQDINVGNITAKLVFAPSNNQEFTLGADRYHNADRHADSVGLRQHRLRDHGEQPGCAGHPTPRSVVARVPLYRRPCPCRPHSAHGLPATRPFGPTDRRASHDTRRRRPDPSASRPLTRRKSPVPGLRPTSRSESTESTTS